MKEFNILPKEREKAKEQIKRSQEKQKKYHDRKIKTKPNFEIEDKVIYYNKVKEK